MCKLSDTISDMQDVEMRLSPDEAAYIVNLTAGEAKKVLEVTCDSAKTVFETSVSCIGSSICQVGLEVQKSGKDFITWYSNNSSRFEEIAGEYTA